MPDNIVDRLAAGRIVLLDGATGTELARRGLSIETAEWSARALWEHPETIRAIHENYVNAGAEIITANTFRTHARNLQRTGHAGEAAELTRRAVELARRAAGNRALAAGSQAPLEDCYFPELTPGDAELEREHEAMSRNLADAGVDLILVETQNTIREAVAATAAAAATGLPVMVSFVCDLQGRLLSGETVGAAVGAVSRSKPVAVLANCLPVAAVPHVLDEMRVAATDVPVGAYANIGVLDEERRWIDSDAVDPERYAVHAGYWLAAGAQLVGGCCGTTPGHIRELRRLIDGLPAGPSSREVR